MPNIMVQESRILSDNTHLKSRKDVCDFLIFFSFFFLVFSSNGSVKVDFQLLVNSKSNVTAQAVNQTLLKNNGTNNQRFIFGNILVQGKFIPLLPGRQSWKN